MTERREEATLRLAAELPVGLQARLPTAAPELPVEGAAPPEPADVAGGVPVGPGSPTHVDPATLDGADASLLALVDRLAAVLERSDLLELEVEVGGTALVLRRPEAHWGAAGPGPGRGSSPGAPGSETSTAEAPAEPARAAVKAPLTGIWYSAPAPGSGPFVQVGGEVAVGQVIGLIEAMKLFNEIKSDLAGRVVRVVAENGQLVKAKQTLIEVEPL